MSGSPTESRLAEDQWDRAGEGRTPSPLSEGTPGIPEELEAHRSETGTREASRPKLAHMILLTECKLDNPDEDSENTKQSWNTTVQNVRQRRSHRESKTGGDEGP